MPGLQLTACVRCRDQKIRCSRTLPRCQKCARIDAPCDYPEPPDRKLVAARRRPWRSRKAVDAAQNVSQPRESDPASILNQRHDSGTVKSCDPTGSGPLRTLLVDIFFRSFFQSSLAFHRSTFEQDLLHGQIPRHTLLAVTAIATRLIDPTSLKSLENTPGISPLANIKALGNEWALEASSEMLQTEQRPGLPIVRTCQLLAFYWFSRGDQLRHAMFGGMAYRLIRAVVSSMKDVRAPSIAAEQIRRLFWSAFVAHALNSENYVLGSSKDALTKKVPLPANDQEYHRAKGDIGNNPQTLDEDFELHTSTGSLMAELVKASFYWARVRDFLAKLSSTTILANLDHILQLDLEIVKNMTRLPSQQQYTKSNLENHLQILQEPIFVTIHSVYHQTRLVLHGSMISHINGIAIDDKNLTERIKTSALAVLHSAKCLSRMAADLLELGEAVVRLSPFVGYAMYASASILLPFTRVEDAVRATAARRNLASSLRVLEAMSPYWEILRIMWMRMRTSIETESVIPIDEEAAERLLPESSDITSTVALECAPVQANLLTESLSESVLSYGLPGLREKSDINSDSKMDYQDDIPISGSNPINWTANRDENPTYPQSGCCESTSIDPSSGHNVDVPHSTSGAALWSTEMIPTTSSLPEDWSRPAVNDLTVWSDMPIDFDSFPNILEPFDTTWLDRVSDEEFLSSG